jgi:RsiW-degrading membrane proteinase PrsW (M82 family)
VILTGGLVLLMLFCGFLVLATAGLESGPVAFGLAVLLAILPVPVYLALVLFVDRFEPEPLRMIALTFFWGATIAACAALIVNTVGEVVVSESYGTEAAELYGYSISAPIVEEVAKAGVIFGIYRLYRREFNGVVDGIVYAALVGLGFAMTENVLYYGRGAAEEGIIGAVGTFVVRGLMSPFAHPVFTAMTGIGIGIASVSRSPRVRTLAPLGGLAAAIALHSLWNTSAGAGLFFAAYLFVMVPVFVLIGVVVLVALRREGRIIQAELSGALPPAEVRMYGSLRERRRWRREAERAGGKPARRAMADLQRTAAELAFQRHQVRQGTLPSDRLVAARESALIAQLARRRRELGVAAA